MNLKICELKDCFFVQRLFKKRYQSSDSEVQTHRTLGKSNIRLNKKSQYLRV